MSYFPDSQLGSKSELIDTMLIGEPVITLADGAFYADYGVKDMGILLDHSYLITGNNVGL